MTNSPAPIAAGAEAGLPELTEALRRMGLAEAKERPRLTRLGGGVSSDIWRVDLRSGPVCVKRALAKLRVEQDWFAPVERSRYEVAWLRAAAAIAPHSVPKLLGVDQVTGSFAMEFLDPLLYRNWKEELCDGRVDMRAAAAVGGVLARIHAATAGRADIAATFPSDAIFHAIRLAPYLEATALRHPDLAPRLKALVKTTANTKAALVHGDVSPKNILLGAHGPLFLDAECAWYGDPAFDIAFCLNHLLLKCLWRPAAAPDFLTAFDTLAEAYLAGVKWEMRAAIEARIAALLPGLFLARIDGKSPVEYVTEEDDKNRVRRVARHLLEMTLERVAAIRAAWAQELGLA
jgi:5-methylthioribose kinase